MISERGRRDHRECNRFAVASTPVRLPQRFQRRDSFAHTGPVHRVNQVNNTTILNQPWPHDLDPETVPFASRTETVLRRHGFYNDPNRFNTLSVEQAADWWNTGPVTIADLSETGNASIRLHHAESGMRARVATDLEPVGSEPWAAQVWHHDPRFIGHLPNWNSTVHEIATTGSAADRRVLWDRVDGLYAAIDTQTALGLAEAVAQYVELISGQHRERLRVLLERTGLSGRNPTTGGEAGRMLGVSRRRIYQLEQQLANHRTRTVAPAGVWMPQVTQAQLTGWPAGYTETGIAAITGFVSSH